jgi:hypothetical protein
VLLLVVDDDVELDVVELVDVELEVDELEVVVMVFPSLSVPAIFSTPPVLPNEAFTARST